VKRRNKKIRFICGSSTGYIRHLRKYERPCAACLVGSETYTEQEIIDLVEDFKKWNTAQRLWKIYQLSLDRFEQIFEDQGRRCACCENPDPGKSPWCVDHDPQTGLLRGILCSSCNDGIAQLGDNLLGLQQAVTYLQAHQTRGGHERAKAPPNPQSPSPKISKVMRQCFDLFKQGLSCDKAVIILQLTPATAAQIYELWSTRGGEIDPVSRHIFQIPKDPPQRFMCACGYTAPWENPEEMSTAIELVNVHIREADSPPETEWKKKRQETQSPGTKKPGA
jgi:hypothetical protein